MLIRFARSEDVAAIGALWQELIAYHQALGDVSVPQPAHDGAYRYGQRVRDHLEDPYSRVIVAEVNQRVVGYVIGLIADMMPEMFEAHTSGFLADIYVQPVYRGQGIGQALVNALREWFYGRGVMEFEWYVAAANADGIAFWQSIGGRTVMLRMRASTREDET